MTIVVGIPPGKRGKTAVHLAGMLARSLRQELLLCSVAVGAPRPSDLPEIDSLYHSVVDRQARESLEAARAIVPGDVVATTRAVRAASAPRGLLDVAQQSDAVLLVLGSSKGPRGRIALGGSTSRILHSSPLPVALAPRGYRAMVGALTTRLTAAYAGSDDEEELLLAAAGLAARAGVPLRIVSWAVYARFGIDVAVESVAGTDVEDPVLSRWTDGLRSSAEREASRLRALRASPPSVEVAVGAGRDWAEALEDTDWFEGEVLLIGSSEASAMSRVFLGSHASKIVRCSPVPVVVVPGRSAEQLADQAVSAPGSAGS